MDSYSEVRRVRAAMSAAAGHDVRRLIATINQRRKDAAARMIDPGKEAEQCDVAGSSEMLTDKVKAIPASA